MSPTFNDGDLLVVDTDDKMPGDGIYIVCDGQGFVVRRVQYIPGSSHYESGFSPTTKKVRPTNVW